MTREEALEKLTDILEHHRPHRSFGCECMLETAASQQNIDATPTLHIPWSRHVAEISFEHAKGF